MRRAQGHGATHALIGSDERISEALAVIIVGEGHGHFLDAAVHDDFGKHHTLTGVGRCGAEEQAIVLDHRQGRRGGRRRNVHDAVRHGDVVNDGGGHARAIGPHDGGNAFGGDQAFGGGRGSGSVDAGGIGAYGGNGFAIKESTGLGDFGHGQFSRAGHGRCQRFNRA